MKAWLIFLGLLLIWALLADWPIMFIIVLIIIPISLVVKFAVEFTELAEKLKREGGYPE
jgi:hypothetical protein